MQRTGAAETGERDMHVATSSATETTTGVEGAKDVDVTVEIDGIEYDGEVTLVPDAINGGWRAYGDAPDYWVSGKLLRDLKACNSGRELREILNAIEVAAANECERA